MNRETRDTRNQSGTGIPSGLDARIERERRLQTRSKRIRAASRWTAVLAGVVGVACIWAGIEFELKLISGLGCTLLMPAIIAATILFFMGGLAPTRVRRILTKRERDLLDD